MLLYEKSLDRDAEWALSEGSRFFEEKSAVQNALRKITQRLSDLGIPYAVVGGMALFSHGFRRFTEDVDLLVRQDDLPNIHQKLEGRGYLPPFRGSKNLRDSEYGVRIEFLVTGQFPGDGKPKPVAFPDPSAVSIEKEGIAYLNLPTLVELKLASGISNVERLKDLADVQELIRILDLPRKFRDTLNPYVHGKYEELWANVNGRQQRYLLLWQSPFSETPIQSFDELFECSPDLANQLHKMKRDGVQLDTVRASTGNTVFLFTIDPEIAKKYDMHDESEFMS